MTEASMNIQMVDSDEVLLENMVMNFIDRLPADEKLTVVSIIGRQNTGKSHLLNCLFGTDFNVLDPQENYGQTTRGIWIAQCPTNPSIVVIDIEGSDSSTNAQNGTSFANRAALFALTISDVLLLNMEARGIGQYEGGSMPLLQTIFGEKISLSPCRTRVEVTLRDCRNLTNDVDRVRAEEIIRECWNSGPATNGRLEDYIEVSVVTFPNATDSGQAIQNEFQSKVAQLREKLTRLTPTQSRDTFLNNVLTIWPDISSNRNLDIPSFNETLSKHRCNTIMQELSPLDSNEFSQLRDMEDTTSSESFQTSLAEFLTSTLERFHESADGTIPKVRDEFKARLQQEIINDEGNEQNKGRKLDVEKRVRFNVFTAKQDWKNSHRLVQDRSLEVALNDNVNEWRFENSLFFPGGDPPVNMSPALYEHREKLPLEVISILDNWWRTHKELCDSEDAAFEHNKIDSCWCSVKVLKTLMDPSVEIGSELVETVLKIMQYETPVKHPWFFISPYLSILMHDFDEQEAGHFLKQLYLDQFEKIKWLFVPICRSNHWVLVAIDLPARKIHYFTSHGENNAYLAEHFATIKWLKKFLAWRLSDPAWSQVQVTPEDCPKQGNTSMDCELFVLRFVYNIITETAHTFSQADISKERVAMVMRLLSHPNNVHRLIANKQKKLLVLDLNGILVEIFNNHRSCDHVKIGYKCVIKRPFCDEFLHFCFTYFEVGIWSSRVAKNLKPVSDHFLGDLKKQLLFEWDQSKCINLGVPSIGNSEKPVFCKNLKKLWDKEELDLRWEKGQFTEANTLLVDDSPEKAICNPPYTGIFPYSFKSDKKDDKSLGRGGDLRMYLEQLATAMDVQSFVKDHPFGQKPITKDHPDWTYYNSSNSQP